MEYFEEEKIRRLLRVDDLVEAMRRVLAEFPPENGNNHCAVCSGSTAASSALCRRPEIRWG